MLSISTSLVLDWSKLKTLDFEDGKLNVAELMKPYVSDRLENIVGKGENAGRQQ